MNFVLATFAVIDGDDWFVYKKRSPEPDTESRHESENTIQVIRKLISEY